MTQLLRRAHQAMGTWFEAVLRGDDLEHLDTVASAVFEEIDRVERLLSRFDPRSEVGRVNRWAAVRAVRVDVELHEILNACRSAWERTDGYFDVATAPTDPDASAPTRTFADVVIDPDRTVRFTRPGVALDLGGFGKGYALDRGAEILARFGVNHALLHGGTSSVLAVGDDGKGLGWPVGVRDPFRTAATAGELFVLRLCDRGLSCSGVFGDNPGESDVIDARRGRPLTEPSACVTLAGSATEAEVYSTALLGMGRVSALGFHGRLAGSDVTAVWIAPGAAGPTWEWITGDAP